MPLDRSAIGRVGPPQSLLITRSRLRQFARATGQTDPVYVDVDAALRAGHRDLPAPPTFVFSVELEAPEPLAFLTDLGIDLSTVLHGEQEFHYHAMAYAGDVLTLTSTIVDVYERKAGLLGFVVRESVVTNQNHALVARLRATTVAQRRARVAEAS